MKNRMFLALALLTFVALTLVAAQRADNAPARDSSLIPSSEVDLTPIVLSDANAATVDLSSLGGNVVWILVYADGDFVEGSSAPSAANNLPRLGSTYHQIATVGRNSWQFRRVGGATVTIRGKAMLAQ